MTTRAGIDRVLTPDALVVVGRLLADRRLPEPIGAADAPVAVAKIEDLAVITGGGDEPQATVEISEVLVRDRISRCRISLRDDSGAEILHLRCTLCIIEQGAR